MQDLPEDPWLDDDEAKSKTQVKKEMLALQDLGVQLTELNAAQLDKMPLSDSLRKAIDESHKITQRSARKRHFQFIGKLMRDADGDAIQAAYDAIQEQQTFAVRQQHQIEHWRDQLLTGETQAVQAFVEQFPGCDIQQLRQLIRAAQKEASQQKPPSSARKLFKFIRACFETASEL
ncbi:ribosome-associated protein [Alteromonadaceae bacterium 2753L.S.0a.02]|nr:ribosome-associated protein [Alteromonadaceae bacterium 2753L.S.0a.02]